MLTAIQKMPHWILLLLAFVGTSGLLDASEIQVGSALFSHAQFLSAGVAP